MRIVKTRSQLLAWELDASDDSEGEEVHESDHKTDTEQSDWEDIEEYDTPLPPNVLLSPHAEDILFRANADNSFRVVSHEPLVLSNNLSSQMELLSLHMFPWWNSHLNQQLSLFPNPFRLHHEYIMQVIQMSYVYIAKDKTAYDSTPTNPR